MNDHNNKIKTSDSGLPLRMMAILLVLAFVGGIILAGWMAARFNLFGSEKIAETTAISANPQTSISSPVERKPAAQSGSANLAVAETRVDDLENRLSQINADAQIASGNAARAEGMLIAFSARRAIDNGAPLGYIADQLQLRFGAAQPQAVQTIIEAARQPVTLDMLQNELDALGGRLVSDPGGGIWETVKREMGELFVLRKEGSAPPAPIQHLRRAVRLTNAGNISEAVREIRTLPGATLAQGWMDRARRYLIVQNALDRIERAAIMTSAPLIPQTSTLPNSPAIILNPGPAGPR